jgi:hypothetical protein
MKESSCGVPAGVHTVLPWLIAITNEEYEKHGAGDELQQKYREQRLIVEEILE